MARKKVRHRKSSKTSRKRVRRRRLTAKQAAYIRHAKQVAARRRRADTRRYGSVRKAQEARRRERKEAWARRPLGGGATMWSYYNGEWTPIDERAQPRTFYEDPPVAYDPPEAQPAPSHAKDLVEKLLRLAKSSNPHEADLARERAHEIAQKYNLRIY